MDHRLVARLLGSLRQWRGKRDSASLDQRQDLRADCGSMLERCLESPEESPLEMALRHVRLGERHVTRQAQIFEQLLADGGDVKRAEALLVTHLEFLKVAREHLQIEEARAAEGLSFGGNSARSLGDLRRPPA